MNNKENRRSALVQLVSRAEDFITNDDGFPAAVVLCVVCVPADGGIGTTVVAPAIHRNVRMTEMQALEEARLAIERRIKEIG